ncbi:uncharacterized protein LOC109801744 [Cajanus cajan]|uniref:uncharacterized protein LOC109801744 n=1 Tax=Cajanus cajan TaxID=3821 RepID=UPI0010FB1C46|nr:uncharacterized protein LOC109801744 [Cajanus cajan]
MLPSRQVASRSRSMPNPQNTPTTSHQNARVRQQSEPIANVESSQEEVQAEANETENVPDNSLVVHRRTSPYWTVDVIDGEGHISQTRLRVQDVFAMTDSPTKILTQWNRHNQPVGDSSSLLAGFLGQVASNFGNFPILYEKWTQVPEEYKNNVFVNTIQANFVVNDQKHKEYIFWSLGKKWKDKRCRLFDKFHDWEKSVEQNIQNHPPHIPQDHWAIFVRYRQSNKAMDMSNKNAANRAKLMIPHILGSKTLARKRDELELLHGREFSRAEMYQVSHKKPDGNFVNEEARELHEKLENEMQNCSENEAFERVCGKEHPGYVRGMGLGVRPSQIIGSFSYATSSTTSFQSNEKMEQMQAEIVDIFELFFLPPIINKKTRHVVPLPVQVYDMVKIL